MKNRKDILIILVAILTCFQVLLFIKSKNIYYNESKPVVSAVLKENILIRDIDNSLNYFKNYKVISRVKSVDGWVITLRLIGNKEDINYNINLLDEFIVKNYNINFKNGNYEVELELKSK